MAINDTATRRAFERSFFLAIAIVFPLIVLIGFGPTYYLKPLFPSPPIPRAVIHLHGLLMTAWVVLFILQVFLIRTTKIKVHQRLGLLSIILGLAIIPTGLVTAVLAAKYGAVSTPPGADRLEFMIVPFFDMIVFPALFGAALYYRRNAANHKRLMLLTVINFIPAALARFPLGLTEAYGPFWFFGVPDLLAVIFLIVDTWRNRKLNVAFLVGTIFLIVMQWVRLPLSTTPAWHSFAAWVTGG